jgi:hypothetical protein
MLPASAPMRPDAIDVASAVARARLDVAETPEEALNAMTPAEKMACLSDPVSLEGLIKLATHDTVSLARHRHARV